MKRFAFIVGMAGIAAFFTFVSQKIKEKIKGVEINSYQNGYRDGWYEGKRKR